MQAQRKVAQCEVDTEADHGGGSTGTWWHHWASDLTILEPALLMDFSYVKSFLDSLMRKPL